jgi:SAM-dependent methyltransferase
MYSKNTKRVEMMSNLPRNGVLTPAEAIDVQTVLNKLESEAPKAFTVWRELFKTAHAAYEGNPPDSCSVEGNMCARVFTSFCENRLEGIVLDVGCGTQATPLYLKNYPASRIVGIDPLLPECGHPFTFVRGYAEYLPFENDTFNTVIAATSLDHTLIPRKALDEIRRVLKPFGHFILWEGLNENSNRDFWDYDPYALEPFAPADKFHLFNFSRRSLFEFITSKFCLYDYHIEGASFMIDAVMTKGCK